MNTHEELTRKHAVRGSSDRSFGLIIAAFFALIGLAPLWKHHPLRVWALGLSALFLVAGVVRPALLHPLNRAWIQLGLLLGRVVNPIVMSVLFFVVVSPIAIILRLLGKDPLRLSFDSAASSYWIERRPPGPMPETMSNQF